MRRQDTAISETIPFEVVKADTGRIDLLNMVVETACGKQTKAEALGFVETAIARVCNYV